MESLSRPAIPVVAAPGAAIRVVIRVHSDVAFEAFCRWDEGSLKSEDMKRPSFLYSRKNEVFKITVQR